MAKKKTNNKILLALLIVAGVMAVLVGLSIWMPFEVTKFATRNDLKSGFDFFADSNQGIAIKIYMVFSLLFALAALVVALLGLAIPALPKHVSGFVLATLGALLLAFGLLMFFSIEPSELGKIARGVGVYINVIASLIILVIGGYIGYKEMV